MANLTTIEKFLQQTILPDLEKGRPNWDKPHTEAVVHYLKEIIAAEPRLKAIEKVLVITAYAHDWGYSGLFEDGKVLDWQDILNAKQRHAEIGELKVRKLLKKQLFNDLKSEEKERISYLVRNHDVAESWQNSDEDMITLMEADTLGGLDITFVTPTLNKRDNDKFMQGVKKLRLANFIHATAKKLGEKLYNDRSNYYLGEKM